MIEESTVKIEIPIENLNIDATKVLLEVGNKWVAGQFRQNIRQSQSDKGKLQALKPKTIAYKKRMGYSKPERPLQATGLMMDSIKAEKVATNYVRVFIDDDDRSKIGEYHMAGNARLPERRFFTFRNESAKRQCVLRLQDLIRKEIRNAVDKL